MSINQRIKEALQSRGLTQENFADRMGIGRVTVNRKLNDDNNPVNSLKWVVEIYEMTGVRLEWLVLGTGEMFSTQEYLQITESELEERIIRNIEEKLDERYKIMERQDQIEKEAKKKGIE